MWLKAKIAHEVRYFFFNVARCHTNPQIFFMNDNKCVIGNFRKKNLHGLT